MRGFYWSSGVVRCSFCGLPGHNITTCHEVHRVAQAALYNIENDISYTFTIKEQRALYEIKRREERKQKLFKRKRRKPRCSYCGELKHKRPNCESLKDFRLMTYQANKNWKKLFSKRISKLGLGIGSLVKVHTDMFYNYHLLSNQHEIAMIVDYDYNNTNVFCAYEAGTYQSNANFTILIGEETHHINLKHLSGLLGYGLVRPGWWLSNPPEIISPMPWEPDQEWMDREYDEVLSWFFKNVKKEDAEKNGLYGFIEEWAS